MIKYENKITCKIVFHNDLLEDDVDRIVDYFKIDFKDNIKVHDRMLLINQEGMKSLNISSDEITIADFSFEEFSKKVCGNIIILESIIEILNIKDDYLIFLEIEGEYHTEREVIQESEEQQSNIEQSNIEQSDIGRLANLVNGSIITEDFKLLNPLLMGVEFYIMINKLAGILNIKNMTDCYFIKLETYLKEGQGVEVISEVFNEMKNIIENNTLLLLEKIAEESEVLEGDSCC
ncbi:hypothetical protein [Tissierella sp.]|uniref:hypothetical protein n=1 Tax=Tissierella sp. TaxID=41274 RepID=UPI003074C60B